MHGTEFSWLNFVFQNKPAWFPIESVALFVTFEGVLMIIGATLLIANHRIGGFLIAVSVLL